ncbi:hypothetical protein CR513_06277, partial [Mucuna pruriens]
MVLRENGEVESSQYEGYLLMVRRLMSNLIKEETESQRETSFHSRCLVLGKLCSLIIDGGSSINMDSFKLVEKLVLPTLPYPSLISYNG